MMLKSAKYPLTDISTRGDFVRCFYIFRLKSLFFLEVSLSKRMIKACQPTLYFMVMHVKTVFFQNELQIRDIRLKLPSSLQ